MCTAISFRNVPALFGRNLDVKESYGENVIITPRRFPFEFSNNHFAFIGTGIILKNFPLYFDGTNEKGLSIAALRFKNEAYYFEPMNNKINIQSFNVISYILSQCETVEQCRKLFTLINITNENFSAEVPCEPLHWIISDKLCSITVESVRDGIKVYENNVDVLTNEPSFDIHIKNLETLQEIPGDNSSQSRFLRCEHVKRKAAKNLTDNEQISQFFHILSSVEQQKNLSKDLFTVYSSCCDTEKGIYYYKTYDHHCINAIDMYKEELNGKALTLYPMKRELCVIKQN